MAVIWRYQFEIQPGNGQTSQTCHTEVRDMLAAWVRGSFRPPEALPPQLLFDGAWVSPSAGQQIQTDQGECDTHRLATLEWIVPEPPAAEYLFQLSAVLAADKQAVEASLLLQYLPRTFALREQFFSLREPNPLAQLPSLLSKLLRDWPCRIEGWPLGQCAQRLSKHEVDSFVQEVLVNPKRVLPVVLLYGGRSLSFADVDLAKAQNSLQALAQVAVLHDEAAAVRLANLLGMERSLYGGVLRMYWPGFTRQASAQRHPLRTLEEFEKLAPPLGQALYRILTPLNANCIREGRIIRAAREALATVPRRQRQINASFALGSSAEQMLQQMEADFAARLSAEQQKQRRVEASFAAHLFAEQQKKQPRKEPRFTARSSAKRKKQPQKKDDFTSRLAALESELQQVRQERENQRQRRQEAEKVAETLRRELDSASLIAATTKAQPGGERGAAISEELSGELERVWDENDRLVTEGEAARQRIAELEAELRVSKENWALLGQEQPSLESAPSNSSLGAQRSFDSAAAALRSAADEFADVLSVWEDAWRSTEQSTFSSPHKLFQALQAIAEVGRAYFEAQQGGPLLGPVERAFANRVPFKYSAFESQTTLSRYGAERTFHHGEQSRQMRRHLTLGGGTTNNCLQIYFDFDDVSQRVLIGYCGRHLRFCRQRT